MDRFELESKITGLHSIVDSLNDISYGILEANLSQDEIANALDGLAVVVELKIAKLFDTFVQTFNLDEEDCGCESDEYLYDTYQ